MRFFFCILGSIIVLLSQAASQPPIAPKIYRSIFGYTRETISAIEWDTLANTQYYKFYASEDSTFRNMLPGINGTIATGNVIKSSMIFWCFGLYPGTLYYYRVQACNSSGCSDFSNTLALKTTGLEYTPFIRPIYISNTSATLRWSPSIDVSISTTSIIQKYQTFLLPDTLKTEVKQSFQQTLHNLRPGIQYYLYVQSDANTFTGGSWCPFKTLSNKIAPYKKIISYHQLPIFQESFAPLDTNRYYTLSDPALVSEQADDLLLQMRSEGILIDTAWFHEHGLRYDVRPTSPDLQQLLPGTLTIKLREMDRRVEKYKFTRGLGKWISSDGVYYFRYDFDRTTGIRDIENSEQTRVLSVMPNPVNDIAYLSCTLSKVLDVEIVAVNVLGQEYSLAYLRQQPSGEHKIPLDTQNLPAGAYFVQLKSASLSLQKPIMISIIK